MTRPFYRVPRVGLAAAACVALSLWALDPAAAATPDRRVAQNEAQPVIETIRFQPEEPEAWEPPAWLVAGGIGATLLLLALAAAGLVVMRSGGDEPHREPDPEHQL